MRDIEKVVESYRARLSAHWRDTPLAHRVWDSAEHLGLRTEERLLCLAVAALDALEATQKAYDKAVMEAPPDTLWVRDENGERKLIRYIGPTVEELRAESRATEDKERTP